MIGFSEYRQGVRAPRRSERSETILNLLNSSEKCHKNKFENITHSMTAGENCFISISINFDCSQLLQV